MLEQLLSGLKDQALGAINDNPEIPNNKLDGIMDIVGSVTKTEVAKEAKNSGGLGNLMNLFSDNDNNSSANSIQGNITNSVVASLIEKVGLSKSAATSAAATLTPMVLDQITSKNNKTASDDDSPLTDLFGSLLSSGSSKSAGGILGALGGLFKK